MFENVDGRRTNNNGRQSHWYTISSQMSLRLRLAKNRSVFLVTALKILGRVGTNIYLIIIFSGKK